LAVTVVTRSPIRTRTHNGLIPLSSEPSEFTLDSEYSLKLEKEKQADPVYDVTIFDAKTRKTCYQMQCPFLPY
jgi:hypothetical protein